MADSHPIFSRFPLFSTFPDESLCSGATEVLVTHADSSPEELYEALDRFFEDREKEMQKANASTQVLGDEEDEQDEEEDCKLLGYKKMHASDELAQVGEQEKIKAEMANVPESCIKKNYITPEFLLSLAQAVIKETNETLGIDDKVDSSGVIDGNGKMEKGGETWELRCHEKKHARNEVQVSVEGGEELKKARMAEAHETK